MGFFIQIKHGFYNNGYSEQESRKTQKQNSPYNQFLKLTTWTISVRRMRLELTRRNRHYPLKVACLPIPPPAREKVPRTGLEPACLSTHAPETCASTNSATWAFFSTLKKRPHTALLPIGAEDGTRTRDPNLGKVMLYQLSYFRDNGCKDRGIFLFTKT